MQSLRPPPDSPKQNQHFTRSLVDAGFQHIFVYLFSFSIEGHRETQRAKVRVRVGFLFTSSMPTRAGNARGPELNPDLPCRRQDHEDLSHYLLHLISHVSRLYQ